MSDYPETVYWLILIYNSGLRLNVVKPIIQRWRLAENRPLAELFELSPLEWSTTFGLSNAEGEQAARAIDHLPEQAANLARWQKQGLELITLLDPHYPSRLSHTLPPSHQPLLLWSQGPLELLTEPGIAFLGNETPDETATDFINRLMTALIAENIGLVSGYGRGLDRTAYQAMLATPNGYAITILPMGLAAFANTTDQLVGPVQAGQTVLVSPFPPETPYQEKLAEARNLLIDHLALALLVPQAESDSQERAIAALNRGQPVFVGLTDTPESRALIDRGALLLTDAGEVVEMVQQALIDATLSEPDQPEPAPKPVPPSPLLSDAPDEDYSLRTEELEPIDSEEALEILSLGGEVPEILRQRLQQSDDE